MKGILFNLPTGMLHAVIDGNKTVTRRLGGLNYINKNPSNWNLLGNTSTMDLPFPIDSGKKGVPWYHFQAINDNSFTWIVQPTYSVGENVYVKESFGNNIHVGHLIYKADWSGNVLRDTKWSNSLFCGEKNARFFLKIKSVDLERVQDISQEDARLEGVEPMPHRCGFWNDGGIGHQNCYRCAFRHILNKVNKANVWDQNPWVWRYKFAMQPNNY